MITLPKSINNPEEDKLIDMLFTNYANRVYNIALKYIDDKHMAEDIVSEVFLKVIKYRSKFINKGEDDWLALLTIYTKTYCYNIYKYNSRRKTVSIEDANVSNELSATESPYKYDPVEQTITQETNTELKTALLKLSQREQDIIKLKYHFQAKNTEIADLFQMNESTVASTIANIKKKLKKSLEGTGIC